MVPDLQSIKEKVDAGERLDRHDALALFTTQDLFELGRIANSRKEALHGNTIYFGVSLNINHTNICELRCPICAFSTDEDADNAYFYLTMRFYEGCGPLPCMISQKCISSAD